MSPPGAHACASPPPSFPLDPHATTPPSIPILTCDVQVARPLVKASHLTALQLPSRLGHQPAAVALE